MMKLVLIACLLAAVNAGGILTPLASAPLLRSHPAPAPILRAAPLITKTVAVADADYDPNPQYSYNYDIQDALTGDFKNHFESRNGDAVQGSYSLNDADGYRRIVEYTADPINGFNAIVHREPAHVAYAAPVSKVAAPLTYAAPLAKVASPLFQTIY